MNNPLISPGLGVIVWMLVAFGILVFILAKFGWPVVLKSLREREASINDALRAADKAKEEMTQLQARNEDLLKEAKTERDEILRHARATSEKIVEDARRKATEEADRIVASARENIEYEKLKAMHDLKNEIATLSIGIAEKLVGAEISDKQKAEQLIARELQDTHLS